MMHHFTVLFTFLAVLLAGSAVAQQISPTAPGTVPTNPTTSSSCDAENIVQACLASMNPQLTACGPNEWKCLCEQSNNVLTCYNNCPGHPNRFGAAQTKESYCNAASAYSSLSSTTTTTSSRSSTTTTAASTTTTKNAETSTTSSGFTANQSQGAAAALVVEGGGVLAAVVAGLVML